ncbi:MAG: hypothetical protein CME06_17835 [Gemmatimonadetes bacterium]|nr:hypothetical protein [Gemmatimonadota bacterium]
MHRGGRGYARKLLFAILQAIDADLEGVVAVVDADRAKPAKRLAELRKGRDRHRERSTPFPTAVGVADPHGEAWLLDDRQAIRSVLGLPESARIPTVVQARRDAKGALQAVIDESERAGDRVMELIGNVAAQVDPRRCVHADRTGFGPFAKDVRDELGKLP